jgi:hypothetical protein
VVYASDQEDISRETSLVRFSLKKSSRRHLDTGGRVGVNGVPSFSRRFLHEVRGSWVVVRILYSRSWKVGCVYSRCPKLFFINRINIEEFWHHEWAMSEFFQAQFVEGALPD